MRFYKKDSFAEIESPEDCEGYLVEIYTTTPQHYESLGYPTIEMAQNALLWLGYKPEPCITDTERYEFCLALMLDVDETGPQTRAYDESIRSLEGRLPLLCDGGLRLIVDTAMQSLKGTP
jgi:hypothetical protein